MGESVALEWRSLSRPERLWVVLSLAIAGMSILFGGFDYPVIGHDSFLHLNWLAQFTALREQGIFYPRWLPNGFHGLGSPAFYFYPPLAYFAASAVHSIAGGAPEQLYHVVQLSFACVGTLVLYLVLRHRGASLLLALAAALAFSFAGYRFIDVYIRDAFGEHVALSILPLLLLELRSRLRNVAVLAFALALLLVSNVPTAILGGVILLARVVRRPLLLTDVTVAGILALAATAVYWLPVLSLSGLIRTEHLHDDVVSVSAYANIVRDTLSGTLGRLRLIMIVTIIGCAVLAFIQWRSERRGVVTWLLIGVIMLQLPYVTDVLWQRVPPFSFVQFAWRLNAIGWLLCCYAAALRWAGARYAVLGVLITTFAIALPLVPKLIRHDTVPNEPIRYDAPEHATRWTLQSTWAFYYFAMDHESDPDVQVDPGGTVTTIQRMPQYRAYRIVRSMAGESQLHLMYWPYWKAYVDRHEVPLRQVRGLAVVDLPAGSSFLELVLAQSESERVGTLISLVGAAMLVGVLGAASISDFRKRTFL